MIVPIVAMRQCGVAEAIASKMKKRPGGRFSVVRSSNESACYFTRIACAPLMPWLASACLAAASPLAVG